MVCPGSTQLSHDVRLNRNIGFCGFHRHNRMGVGRLHLVTINLSPGSLKQDSSTLHLLSRLHAPIRHLPSKCNVFICRSVLLPGGGSGTPLMKSAGVILARSYDALQRNPVLLQLIPALGIIAFAACGLEPLIRLSRVLFLQRTDSSWKKSSSRCIMTSYIQPLLLWIGAMLICRALDPVILPSKSSQVVKLRLLNFVRSLSTVISFAYCLSSLIQQAQKFFVEANDSSGSRNVAFDLAGKGVYATVWVAAASLFMELLGFSTQRWLTAGGLGTVLLTLAGREIFTNFLSSIMIHATRPFVENEWIQTKIEGYEVSGTVEHVGWWSPTIVRGDDREAVHIPNHKFTVNIVRNLTQKSHWRIKTYIAISHLDVNKINNIVADMRKVLSKNPQVEQQKLHRRVFLENVNPENQALMILISCFVKTSHFEEYLCVKEAILLDLLRVVSHHRARLATPIRTVQKIYSEADSENIPFGDSIFTRSRAANRPYLLIEPPYKVHEDKVKPSTRAARTNEEKDSGIDEIMASDTKGDENFGATSTSSADVNNSRDKSKSFSESQTKSENSVDERNGSTVPVSRIQAQSTELESSPVATHETIAATSQSKQEEEKSSVSSSSVRPSLEKDSGIDEIMASDTKGDENFGATSTSSADVNNSRDKSKSFSESQTKSENSVDERNGSTVPVSRIQAQSTELESSPVATHETIAATSQSKQEEEKSSVSSSSVRPSLEKDSGIDEIMASDTKGDENFGATSTSSADVNNSRDKSKSFSESQTKSENSVDERNGSTVPVSRIQAQSTELESSPVATHETIAATSQSKQEEEKSSVSSSSVRPSLEKNIFLGVVLEDSKRTLPIEEEKTQSPMPTDSQEFAVQRNGGGPPASKDKKDGPSSFPTDKQND